MNLGTLVKYFPKVEQNIFSSSKNDIAKFVHSIILWKSFAGSPKQNTYLTLRLKINLTFLMTYSTENLSINQICETCLLIIPDNSLVYISSCYKVDVFLIICQMSFFLRGEGHPVQIT